MSYFVEPYFRKNKDFNDEALMSFGWPLTPTPANSDLHVSGLELTSCTTLSVVETSNRVAGADINE